MNYPYPGSISNSCGEGPSMSYPHKAVKVGVAHWRRIAATARREHSVDRVSTFSFAGVAFRDPPG